MRFGHSLIDGRFNFIKDNGFMDFANLTEEFFNSDVIYDDGMKYSIYMNMLYIQKKHAGSK